MLATSDVVEYHELALIALSQPLLEALATSFLTAPIETGGYPAGERIGRNWPRMLAKLDRGTPAPIELVAPARLVAVTSGTGRDRLVAHVAPGSIRAGTVGGVEEPKHWRGRIFLGEGPARDQAVGTLRSLNERLPSDQRS
jgi:hypothetical protein